MSSYIKKEKIGIFGDYDVDGATLQLYLEDIFELKIALKYIYQIVRKKVMAIYKRFQDLIDKE